MATPSPDLRGSRNPSPAGTQADTWKAVASRAALGKIFKTTVLLTLLAAVFVVPRISKASDELEMRWQNLPLVFVVGFLVLILYQYLLARRQQNLTGQNLTGIGETEKRIHRFLHSSFFRTGLCALLLLLLIFPLVVQIYHTKVMTLVFIYIIFALGLNVIVGLAGMLCLGQAFFLGVGAYTYALLNTRLGIGFYPGLLAGALSGVAAGFIFALVTLRLRGDYLAIVTLGLSEIFRIVMTNLNFTGGPRGISGIAKPGLWGMELSFFGQSKVLYFVSLALVVLAILLIRRLEHSRLGRSWESLREDEIASAAMGVNTSLVRLGVFALGGLLGGLAGVLFAANTSFIDPNSFAILVSVTALCVVVLGGLGSISGAVLGAVVLIMLPEYLRFFSQYRMLIFGAILVFMMLFRPTGIIPKVRTEFLLDSDGLDSKLRKPGMTGQDGPRSC